MLSVDNPVIDLVGVAFLNKPTVALPSNRHENENDILHRCGNCRFQDLLQQVPSV